MLALVVVALLGTMDAVRAQDLGVKAPAQSRPILIEGATIHPVSGGVIESGYIVLEDGEISAMGRVPAPSNIAGSDPVFIDARGKHAYPGLVSADTLMGLIEVNAIRATRDYAEVGSVTPEVRAAVAVNPDSTVIPVTRSNGVLTCAVLPMGGSIPGRASVIRMDGWTWEDLAIEDDAGLMVNWPSMRVRTDWWVRTSEADQRKAIDENLSRIRESFAQARAYHAAKAKDASTPTDLRWEAMRGVLDGERPVFIRATELDQVQSAVRFAVDEGLKAVIVGGSDAHLCAELLARHDIPVIITGVHRLPGRRDMDYDQPYRLPLQLEAAGVRWCIAATGGSFETPHGRNLPYHAATAVAYGLDPDAALRSITLAPAEILGVGDRLGSIETGKAATLIITDGDPLEVTTQVERAFIDGREIDLENKQTKLRDKYREKYRQLGIIEGEGDDE